MPDSTRKASKRGWTTVAFGDVVRQVKDRIDPEESGLDRYVAGEHMDTDDLRIRRWGLVGDGYLGPAFHMRFKPGHVLYGSRRTYLRKVALADFEGITANTTYVLESSDPEVLLPGLLPFIMQTEAFAQHSVRESKGSVNPYVNFSDLAWFEFALPPIEEQRRLAQALTAIEAALETIRSFAEQCSNTAQALLEARLNRSASSSSFVRVEALLIDGPKNGVSPPVNSDQRGLRTVSIGAVSDGRFSPAGHLKHVNLDLQVAEPYLVQAGDIFAVRGNGNRNLVGLVGLSEHRYQDLVYPDLLMRMRFDPARICPEFLVAQWNHPTVHAKLLARAKSSNGIAKINGKDIRDHELLIPSLPVQREIVTPISRLRAAKQAATDRMTQLRHLKRELFGPLNGESIE